MVKEPRLDLECDMGEGDSLLVQDFVDGKRLFIRTYADDDGIVLSRDDAEELRRFIKGYLRRTKHG